MPLGRRGLFVTILDAGSGGEPILVKQVKGYDDTAAVNPGLRVKFAVEKKLSPIADKASVEIYNLNANSRASTARRLLEMISDPDVRTLQVHAGYRSPERDGLSWHPLSAIFNGAIHSITHRREGPDWITTIEASAGLAQALRNRLGESWDSPAGTPLREVLNRCFSNAGLGQPQYSPEAQNILAGRVATSQVVSAGTQDSLRRILRATGLIYRIEPETVWVTAPGHPLSTADADLVIVSDDTGMIGTPKLDNQGASLRTLLDGRVTPGTLLRIESETLDASTPGLNSDYTAFSVSMKGDTHSDDWYSDIRAIFYPPLPDVPPGGAIALARLVGEQN